MILKRTTDAATEPVSLAEAKLHLRVDGDDEDSYLTGLITAARNWCENYQGRAYITQTWRLSLDRFPSGGQVWRDGEYLLAKTIGERMACGVILLPRPPAIAITSITYTDTDGNGQTLSASAYTLDSDSEPARLYPSFDYDWPDTRDSLKAGVITYTAGYGAATAVPETVKHAIKLLLSHWYENREAVISGTISKGVEFALESLLHQERIY